MSTHDESAAFLAHIAAETARLSVTGDTRPGGPPVLLRHADVTVYRVFKDGEPFTRTFWFATRPVRSEFDDGVFDVRALPTWDDACSRVMDFGGGIEHAIPAALVDAIDRGELPA